MSDDQPVAIPAKIDVLSQEDIRSLFDSIKVKSDCELCGINDWILSDAVDNKYPAIIAIDDATSVIGAFTLRCLLTVCNNCGNVRTFARYVLDKKLKEINNSSKDA